MADGLEDQGRSGDKGVSRGSPASTLEMFDDDPNAAAPFARLAPRSKGRPAGSPNKRTLAMRDHILRRGYAHPLLWMAETVSRPISMLAEELGCSLLEAAEFQRKVASDMAPYMESKMPAQLSVDNNDGLPVLMIGEIVARRRGETLPEGAMAIDDDLADEVEQFQALEAEKDAKSHAAKSHEDAKP